MTLAEIKGVVADIQALADLHPRDGGDYEIIAGCCRAILDSWPDDNSPARKGNDMLKDLSDLIAAVKAGDYFKAYALIGKLIIDIASALQSQGAKGKVQKLATSPIGVNASVDDCTAALEAERQAGTVGTPNWSNILQILLTLAKLLFPSL